MGESTVGGVEIATEWSDDTVINLGGLSGSTDSQAQSINDAGRVVGESFLVGGEETATEWSGGIGGSVIDLGGLSGSTSSFALGINHAGQAVGGSGNFIPSSVPESSTWAMMLVGFAGLALTGYRRVKAGDAKV